MVTNEMIKRWKDLADELFFDYEKVCIRTQDVPFEIGSIDHLSHVWVGGEDTGEELDGLCALSIDHADLANIYVGDHVSIVAGNEYSYGADVGEIILRDAVVVEILA